MKNKLSMIAGGFLVFMLSHSAIAQSTTYTVSASVPAGSGVGITVNSVNTATGVFTPVTGTTLTYSPLSFNSTNNVFLANNYFTLDVAVTGAGAPQTTVSYVAGSVPTGATSTLGSNSSLAYDKEVYTSSSTPPTQSTIPGFPTVVLSSLTTAQTVPYTSVNGGWLRLYMGLCTGNTSTDPAGCKPFSGADAVGSYTGSLTVSAVVN
jgi:hypothetical protein